METKEPDMLDALIEAGKAATPGEWKTNLVDETLVTSASRDVAKTLGDYDTDECELMAADATFIALAKNALPSLIALRERVKKLEAALSDAAGTLEYLDREMHDSALPYKPGPYAKEAAGYRSTLEGK